MTQVYIDVFKHDLFARPIARVLARINAQFGLFEVFELHEIV